MKNEIDVSRPTVEKFRIWIPQSFQLSMVPSLYTETLYNFIANLQSNISDAYVKHF